MKKLVIGALTASLILSFGLGVADAKGKGTKKDKTHKTEKVDKDRNGIPDVWQKKYNLGYGKSVPKRDNDKDGLNNFFEYKLNLNPKSKDTDKDKLPDGKEDYDKDQLTNLQDIQAKLNPLTKDTDKDGIKDAEEDNDSDKLNTKEEFIVGTNSTNADSDKDGITDGEEDRDNDKIANYLEFELGYNPKNSDSDRDGLKDGDEDFDRDGVPNSNEVKELEIKLIDSYGKKFKLEYELSKEELEIKFKDEIGITDPKTVVDRLTLTPDLTEEELIDQVKRVLGINTFSELKIEVEFVNGQELEVNKDADKDKNNKDTDENADEDAMNKRL